MVKDRVCEAKVGRFMAALKICTHVGKRTEIIYAKDSTSAQCQSFGATSCSWYKSNVSNDKLDNKDLFYTRDEYIEVLKRRGDLVPKWAVSDESE